MRIIKYILWITLIVNLCSCEGFYEPVTYDSSFPKKNYDLTKVLGSEIKVKYSDTDSICDLLISNKGDFNLITDLKGDTVFIGKVCKYRGLYYFNEQLGDTSFNIFAVMITDSLIFGLNSCNYQMGHLEVYIRKGEYKELVKYINADSTKIKLTPDKKAIRKYSKFILQGITPDTIINNLSNTNKVESEIFKSYSIDKDEYAFFLKVYPNPTTEKLFVSLQDKGKVLYSLTDYNGRILLNGQFNEKLNELDFTSIPYGIYQLTISDFSGVQKETINVMKTK